MGHRARFLSGISPCAGPWGYRHGGRGQRGGGTCSPSPVFHAPDTLPALSRLRLRKGIPIRFYRPPPHAPSAAGNFRPSAAIRGRAGRLFNGSPCLVLLQDLPMLWTVWISPRGETARGEGELVPPPLSPPLQPSYFSPASPTPPVPAARDTQTLPRQPPPRPRLRRSSPAPPGVVAVLTISGGPPCTGAW